MHGANDDHHGPRDHASTPRSSSETGDGRLTLVSSRPRGHGEVPLPRETALGASRQRRSLGRLSNATLIGLACAGSIGAVGAVNASLFPSLGHPTSESVWQNPGKVPTSTAGHTAPSARAERVVVVDPTFALVVGVVPQDGAAGAAIESTSTEPAPPSTLDSISAAQAAVASGSSRSGSGSVRVITTSTAPKNSSPTGDDPDHSIPSSPSSPSSPSVSSTPSTPSTPDDHGVDHPDTTADTTPSVTVDSTPSDTTDPSTSGKLAVDGGSGSSGSGKGGSRGD